MRALWLVVILIIGAVVFAKCRPPEGGKPGPLPLTAADATASRKLAQKHADLGHEYVMTGRYVEAVRELNKVIKLYDKEASVYFNLGYAHYALKDYKKAVENYQKALELQPDDPAAEKNLRLALDKLRQAE